MATIIDKCPKCGQDISEQEWGKNPKNYGKPYHAWRHVEKNPDCDFIEWISDTPKRTYAPKKAPYAPKNTQESASQIVAMRKLYALILAVAHLQGVKQEDLDAEIKRMEFQGK